LSLSLGQSGFEGLDSVHSPRASASATVMSPETPPSAGSYSYGSRQYPLINRTLSKSFANELSKVFNIDEDPQVEELEKNLREKLDLSLRHVLNCRNQRLSMQTNELEMLSQRIREAEERLRRVEEENEDTSSGRPTPPVSPFAPPPPPPEKDLPAQPTRAPPQAPPQAPQDDSIDRTESEGDSNAVHE
jgi:hypothetical protein